MKRAFDILIVLMLSVLLLVPGLVIAIAVRLTSNGPALYWSDRVGKNNKIFKMAKFRSMYVNTPVVATHLLVNPEIFFTPIGRFLRKSSLDELPQLWNIFVGDMSFVGPRPALYNQKDLIRLRTDRGIEVLLPGITGWAQINGRDELEISRKVEFDEVYMRKMCFIFDLKIMWLTLFRVFSGQCISH